MVLALMVSVALESYHLVGLGDLSVLAETPEAELQAGQHSYCKRLQAYVAFIVYLAILRGIHSLSLSSAIRKATLTKRIILIFFFSKMQQNNFDEVRNIRLVLPAVWEIMSHALPTTEITCNCSEVIYLGRARTGEAPAIFFPPKPQVGKWTKFYTKAA